MKLLITKMTFALLATASISVVSCEKPATSSEIEATTPVAQTDVAETPVKRGTEPIPVDVSKISFDPKNKQLQKEKNAEYATRVVPAF